MASLSDEISSRRTFAIISHPDAGKTTLTEKLLLYTGSIQTAGSVKGKSSAKHAVSDWMDIEKERGISVTSSVLQFTYNGACVNILDTPVTRTFRRIPTVPLWPLTPQSWSSTAPRASRPRPRSSLRSVRCATFPSSPL